MSARSQNIDTAVTKALKVYAQRVSYAKYEYAWSVIGENKSDAFVFDDINHFSIKTCGIKIERIT
jgi:hypothetical protein